jgi:hypothetical protein
MTLTHLLRKLHILRTPKLGYLGQMAEEHWQEYCPRMYKELKDSGQLEDMLYAVQENTASTLQELKAQGMSHDMAWEFVRELWILLPEEKD